MIRIASCFIFLFVCLHSFAQKAYFQQEVNYKINVTLDDVKHSVNGDIQIEYINHSPDALPVIWMHLWGNAFKNRRTAFCKQKLRDGDSKFYFSSEKDLGYYKNLDFKADGKSLEWKYDPENPDIAVLTLPAPLKPGEKILISTPFLLKIPASFSRLGHVGTSYQMTQWFPKPAVYDHKGWHAIPYLDIGEFYSEFGSFDVSITLPENYVVGATGILETASERDFLKEKVAETRALLEKCEDSKSCAAIISQDSFPKSSARMKTIRYTAQQVLDFAWFADKRFHVLQDTAVLASGKKVDCWAMFTNKEAHLWKKGAFYVKRSVEFYSENVGEYPWPQATAVHSALSAGGGMEYPMITVIGNNRTRKDLDDVITHEVGHNWFMGILASNEREHPFMDEGMNSYYEYRYMRRYYDAASTEPVELPRWIYDAKQQGSMYELSQLFLAKEHQDLPPDTHSNAFPPVAYGVEVYTKTGTTMRWLEQYLGTEKFDRCMKAYYTKWKFKHPYPEDVKQVFAETTPKNVQWWFDLMQTGKQADYKIATQNPEKGIALKNKGNLDAPVPVGVLKDGKVLETRWYDGSVLNGFTKEPGSEYVVDPEFLTLDVNRRNNYAKRPLNVRPHAPFIIPGKRVLGLTPWLGWNNVDKTQIGLVFYNPPVPSSALQVYVAPGFGLGSKKLTGFADVRYKVFTNSIFPKITLGLSAKTFSYNYNPKWDYYSQMYRIVPQVKLELRDPSISFQHWISVRGIFLNRQAAVFDSTGTYSGQSWTKNVIPELRYEARQKRAPNPWELTVMLEQQDYRDGFDRPAHYVKSSIEWRQRFFYAEKKKITARLFAGYFLETTQRHRSIEENSFSLNPQGFNDYKFDQVFLARSGGAGILGRQLAQQQGGIKGAFGSEFAGVIGNSNNYILSLNLKADLPQKLPLGIPLKPYFDLGYFDDATVIGQDRPRSEQLLWSGGLMLEFFKGGLEFYFPLANSKTLKDRYCEQGGGTNASAIFCGGNYLKMISWSVRVPVREPGQVLDYFIR